MARKLYQGQIDANRAQRDRLLSALDPASEYHQALSTCGTLSQVTHGYDLRCRLPACPRCRSSYASGRRNDLRKMFAGGSNDHGALITLVSGVATDFGSVERLIGKSRKDLRNLVDAHRRKSPAWNDVQMVGWLEMDAIEPEDLYLLGSQRSELLTALGASLSAPSPIWIPTVNLIARFDGLDWQAIRDAFVGKWKVERQAHVEPFRRNLDLQQNTDNLANYALKHRCERNVQGSPDPWPPQWMAAYYLWLEEWSDSFKRTRFKIGAKKSKMLKITPAPIARSYDDDDYGAPVVMVSSSVLPTLYNCSAHPL